MWIVGVLAASAAAFLGGVGGASATTLAACTTAIGAPVATPATVPAGSPITYTATVTASAGCAAGSPSGNVTFFSNYIVGGLPQAYQLGYPVSVVATATPGQSIATLVDSSLPRGTFTITASFKSSDTSKWLNSPTSAGTGVVISSSSPYTTSMTFTESTDTIVAGQPVTFNVHIDVLDQNGQVTSNVATGNVDLTAGPSLGSGNQSHFATVGLDGTGSATYMYEGFVPGDYIVVASYPGTPTDNPSSGQLVLHVLPATSPTASTTALTGSPTSFQSGDPTTLTATVTTSSGPVPAGGGVIFSAGPSATSLTTVGQGITDANGQVQVNAQGFTPGTYVVYAQYLGDSADNIGGSTSGELQILVSTAGNGTQSAVISYTGVGAAAFDAPATLSAHLQDTGGGAIGGKKVTLTMGTQSCTGITDSHGDVSCVITITQDPGVDTVTASFAGDDNWAAESASAPFTVLPAPSALVYTGDTTGATGAQATLAATLTDGGPLSGRTVTFTMGSQSCSGVTDGSGHASCTITISQSAATYPLTAQFGGDTDYASSDTTGLFVVTTAPPAATTTTYTGDTHDLVGSTATLSAHVSPTPDGGTVSFTLGSQGCSAPVSGGNASCTVSLNQPAGSGYTVTATYSGDAAFLTSTASSPFTIVSPTTTTHIAPIAPVLAGGATTLSATVAPSSAPGTVVFSSGGKTLCTATLSGGAASCPASFAQAGSYSVTATYGGNGLYPASSDTTTVIVYAYAPGGGSFVVGDKSASGSVTFWGAQWWKANTLSGGSAPSSFKGFALNPPAPQCSVPWSTDPGNSAPPPAGPLPAYMAVIVSSSITKSGSKISGNVVAIVIVKTDAGYKGDPGHAGTGTVVATIACGS